jgi:hypothetical protein
MCRFAGEYDGLQDLVDSTPARVITRAKKFGPIESSGFMERAMGIEPTSEAWEALVKTLKAIDLAALSFPQEGLSWKLGGN